MRSRMVTLMQHFRGYTVDAIWRLSWADWLILADATDQMNAADEKRAAELNRKNRVASSPHRRGR